ncbi:MAG: hypothetical protein JF888_02850 [Candidatus Dormibacteraeota bacterium]|uniref:Uncharacterized protein n=1 Tax=Candidatus Dormiibacter inghamiae TaxID=3127013 RepID=A0A934K8V6_9BACT|nr:hypothetical protein [Candidatus Dormibacteraeota bacterium]MBJ7605517.1 hypothetical protein [Candidatus Dormibacteraeota bacterium]
MEQPILYAEQTWRSQRIMVIALLAFGVVGGAASLLLPAFRNVAPYDLAGFKVQSYFIYAIYIPLGLLVLAFLLTYRWRSRVELLPEGFKVKNLIRSTFIPYELVRTARVNPLYRHFEGARKRYLRSGPARALGPKPAVFIRLRSQDERFPALQKRLGARLMEGEILALPVPDADGLALDLSARIPRAAAVNRGGQRRPKRSR